MAESYSAADLISAIEKAFPAPENPFEKALYLLNLKWAAEEIALYYESAYNDLISVIKDEPSDEYRVVMTYLKKSSVDIDKLRSLRPDIYERISYVKPNTAEDILSRDTIHDLCRAKAGERISEYESVNKGDLKKALPADEVGQFIKFEDEPAGYAVVEVRA